MLLFVRAGFRATVFLALFTLPDLSAMAQKVVESDVAYAPAGCPRCFDITYEDGNDARQLIVFVHGGGWVAGAHNTPTIQQIGDRLYDDGFAFASIEYRKLRTDQSTPLVDDSIEVDDLELVAKDVARAVATIQRKRELGGYNFSQSTIVLMGHSAGAHLAALVSSNPVLVDSVNYGDHSAISGLVLLDGHTYDLQQSETERPGWLAARNIDPADWDNLSPVYHLGLWAPQHPPAFFATGLATQDPPQPSHVNFPYSREQAINYRQEINANAVAQGGSVYTEFRTYGSKNHTEFLGDLRIAADRLPLELIAFIQAHAN
ncbi:MAG: alpha/beta hydrolase [Pseudomonadota bacterium]